MVKTISLYVSVKAFQQTDLSPVPKRHAVFYFLLNVHAVLLRVSSAPYKINLNFLERRPTESPPHRVGTVPGDTERHQLSYSGIDAALTASQVRKQVAAPVLGQGRAGRCPAFQR